MNKQIRSLINKYAYRQGQEHGITLRSELLKEAHKLEREGKSNEQIINFLGIPIAANVKLFALTTQTSPSPWEISSEN